jgi:DNA transposition AAA+ family ATPase
MLQDLVQVDQLISKLDAVTGVDAQNAAEQLMQTCSANGAAFQHLQERLCDAAISERARNQIHLIIAKIRTWTSFHYTYGWKEPGYA